ncbi:MAG: SDR family oxidoreductase [Chloroflexi bacterium]|nr:SDR family oxidoreductase [Chloroflexota bacterium]
MMRVLVLGGNGMLGHKLCQILLNQMDVWATFQGDTVSHEFLPKERLINKVAVQDSARVREVIESITPDAVVNAVGIVKQRDEAKQAVPSIRVNSLFPHQVADICEPHNIRVIQISTDCVFSGLRGNYSELDVPDPVDLYGRSKLIGELNRPGCLTLRTSIVGWQLNTFTSLLSWFALQRESAIKGYRKAIYSGLTTAVLAQLIGDLILTRPDLHGIYQVASAPITKFDLLLQLSRKLGWEDITIQPDDQFYCDRTLLGTRFTTATGWRAPDWDFMISELVQEWPEYEPYYSAKISGAG